VAQLDARTKTYHLKSFSDESQDRAMAAKIEGKNLHEAQAVKLLE